MTETYEASCAECGTTVEVEIDNDYGDDDEVGLDGGHYTTILVTEEEDIIPDREDTVEPLLDADIEDGYGAAIYTQCGDCCPHCNDEDE